jgi:predicted transposase YbfD/YdcC
MAGGLNAVVVVESRREISRKTTNETRFCITSLVMPAEAVGPMIRAHWAIENSLHWVMDMVFRDDECRVRTDNAPANFANCRHIAYNLTRKAPGKDSIRLRRKPQGGTTTHRRLIAFTRFRWVGGRMTFPAPTAGTR